MAKYRRYRLGWRHALGGAAVTLLGLASINGPAASAEVTIPTVTPSASLTCDGITAVTFTSTYQGGSTTAGVSLSAGGSVVNSATLSHPGQVSVGLPSPELTVYVFTTDGSLGGETLTWVMPAKCEETTAPATDTNTAPATDTNTAPATDTNTAPATDTNTAPATDTNTAPATTAGTTTAATTPAGTTSAGTTPVQTSVVQTSSSNPNNGGGNNGGSGSNNSGSGSSSGSSGSDNNQAVDCPPAPVPAPEQVADQAPAPAQDASDSSDSSVWKKGVNGSDVRPHTGN